MSTTRIVQRAGSTEIPTQVLVSIATWIGAVAAILDAAGWRDAEFTWTGGDELPIGIVVCGWSSAYDLTESPESVAAGWLACLASDPDATSMRVPSDAEVRL